MYTYDEVKKEMSKRQVQEQKKIDYAKALEKYKNYY
jgi:hypothetical protein